MVETVKWPCETSDSPFLRLISVVLKKLSDRFVSVIANSRLSAKHSIIMQTNRTRNLVTVLVSTTLMLVPEARAGMTVYGLRDIYRLRLEEISFFIVLLLVCAFVLKLLWNYAFKEFNAIPRLKYLQALCVALLFGLVMLLILTMISGIREVLTPGAWRHQGTSYRLNDPAQEPARRRSLEHLRGALFEYASTHEGHFPAHDFVPEISEKLWESPDQLGSHYLYTSGITTNTPNTLLAVEPPNFGELRFALRASGNIEILTAVEVEKLLQDKAQR